ncbi:LexA family protein [Variovorax paradoxus]|uniref:LexA family protein n=1 Tax=Variovorax paradoxus TaxID=34073 RepID=UPI002480C92F|nr:XRE family transcriptional regulator [Variovorax paradoxus]WGT64774.1 XRE family transcriptional regulator [Variovorax paradoxus]
MHINRNHAPMDLPYHSTMVDYKTRLTEAMKYANVSVSALAAAIGVSYQAVSKAVDGTTNSLSAYNNSKAADFLCVDARWLATGEGSMELKRQEEAHMVPLVPWESLSTWKGVSEWQSRPEGNEFTIVPISCSNETFCVIAQGDSMVAPHGSMQSYRPGSHLYFDPLRDNGKPSDGAPILAKLIGSDEVTFKIYKQEGARRWLAPLNPQHEPIRNSFTVMGILIGQWTN